MHGGRSRRPSAASRSSSAEPTPSGPGSPSSRRSSRTPTTSPPGEEDALRAERERFRHVAELGEGAAAAVAALDPDEGEGARALAASAERALAPLERLAPELGTAATELRDLALRLGEVASDLHRFADALDADPARIVAVEERLDRIADVRRRHRAATLDELLERRAAALEELEALGGGGDPLDRARAERDAASGALRGGRRGARRCAT